MKLGEVVWWKFKNERAWKIGTVRGFPATELVKLQLTGVKFVVVSEKDIEWKTPQ